MLEQTVIKELKVGDKIEGFYLLKDPQIKMTTGGKPFLRGGISDRTGCVEMKVWDYSGMITAADNGKVAFVSGAVSEYRGNLQVIADVIRLAEAEDQYDLAELIPTAPIDVGQSYQDMERLVASITDDDYRVVCTAVLERFGVTLKTIPAAKSVHHAFLNGLLMHTCNMMRVADFLAGLYNECIDRSLLLAGTLLHDIGKGREFSLSELGLVTDYSAEGNLLGHLVIGAGEVAAVAAELGIPAEKSLLLQHLILSHHGKPEHGAAVIPKCAEATLLTYIDGIDSRMEIYREQLPNVKPGEFSGRVFALDGGMIYRHF